MVFMLLIVGGERRVVKVGISPHGGAAIGLRDLRVAAREKSGLPTLLWSGLPTTAVNFLVYHKA
jgi:hypothetical protein